MLKILFLLTLSFNLFAWDAATEYKKNCATCHHISGGDLLGPDLAGVTERRSEKWLIKFIQYPSGMIEGDEEEPGYEKPDPIAQKLYELYKPQIMGEQELDEDQIKDLLAYIKKESKGKKPKGKIVEFQKSLKK